MGVRYKPEYTIRGIVKENVYPSLQTAQWSLLFLHLLHNSQKRRFIKQ